MINCKKLVLIITFLILILTAPVSASGACLGNYKNSELKSKISRVTRESLRNIIANALRENGQKEYIQEYFENFKSVTGIDGDSSEILHDEFIKGAEHTKRLMEMGFTIAINSMKRKYLKPPSNLADFYYEYYQQINRLLQSGVVSESDIVMPALIYVNRLTAIKILSRPGIDDLPSIREGWELESNSNLSSIEFNQFFADGKIPFSQDMALHEIAHLTDYLSHHHLVKKLKRLFKTLAALEINKKSKGIESDPMDLFVRDQTFNEFLIVMNLKNKTKTDKLFGPWLNSKKTKEEIKQDIEKMLANGELSKFIQDLSDSYFQIVESHGGGARDGRSLTSWALEERTMIQIIKSKLYKTSIDIDQVYYFVSENTFWGLLMQIEYFNGLIDPSRKPKTISLLSKTIYIAFFESKHDIKSIKQALINTVTEFVFRAVTSLQLEITAEQIIDDLADQSSYAKSKTRKYFDLVAAPGTLEHKIYVDGIF